MPNLRSSQNKPRSNNLPKCGDCDEFIEKSDSYLKCNDCHCTYHTECVNVTQKQYREYRKKGDWICENHDDNDGNQNQIGNKLDSIVKQLKEITKSQEFFSSKHDDVIEQLKKIREDNKSVRQEVSSLKKQQHQMRSEIDELKAT